MKPMLARSETLSSAEIAALPYPILASPKLDGMRVFINHGKALTRNEKPVANDFVRNWLEDLGASGLDGELCLPNMTEPLEQVMSAFRSKAGKPDFKYVTFDYFGGDSLLDGFWQRHQKLEAVSAHIPDERFLVLRQDICESEEGLRNLIQQHLDSGFEGTMVRRIDGLYKQGRSTLREGYLLKIKPWHDEEATLTDIEEEMENTNEERTATGARSSAKAGKIPTGRAGALHFRFADGTESSVGGLTDAQKADFWANRQTYLSRVTTLTIKYQVVHGGRKPGQAPRHPQLKGIRED